MRERGARSPAALLLLLVGTAHARPTGGRVIGTDNIDVLFGPFNSYGILWAPTRRRWPAALGLPADSEVVALSDATLAAVRAAGVRLPAAVVAAPVVRTAAAGTALTRAFQGEPSHGPLLRVFMAQATPEDAPAEGRVASSVVLVTPCGSGDLSLAAYPTSWALEIHRAVAPGNLLVCDLDERGGYRVQEQPGTPALEGGENRCSWGVSGPRSSPAPTASNTQRSDAWGAPTVRVPLPDLLARATPAFEAFASVQREWCPDPPPR